MQSASLSEADIESLCQGGTACTQLLDSLGNQAANAKSLANNNAQAILNGTYVQNMYQSLVDSGVLSPSSAFAIAAGLNPLDVAGATEYAFTSNYLSGSGGRWGGASTRQLNYDVGQSLVGYGYTITRGGGVASEEYIPGAGPGSNGGSYVDITAKPSDGVGPTVRVQTVSTLSNGLTPTPSEAAAAARIQAAYPDDTLILIPKGATASQINQAIQGALGK